MEFAKAQSSASRHYDFETSRKKFAQIFSNLPQLLHHLTEKMSFSSKNK